MELVYAEVLKTSEQECSCGFDSHPHYILNFIYKTTNLINGKYYIGMHSTDNLEDVYIGSGKRLWFSIKNYG